MLLTSSSVFILEPLIVRHSVPYGPELRRDEANGVLDHAVVLSRDHMGEVTLGETIQEKFKSRRESLSQPPMGFDVTSQSG